jgi:glutaredoxin
MKKIYLIGLSIFLIVSVLAYGYTHENGSKVFYNEEGNIIGIEDQNKLQSRYPTSQEISKNDYIDSTLGQCLTEKEVIMYGAYWCPHCQTQKELFKEDWKNVNYFECEDDIDYCIKKGIKAYPTWEIEGKQYTGVKELSELSLLTDCPLV